jgi:hypothetical protein
MTYAELAFQFAKEVSTQLITIASALIGVSVTFIKDFRTESTSWLRLSWAFYILSIAFGIWTLMALTGALESLAAPARIFDRFPTSVRWPAIVQIGAFLLATIFLTVFGWRHSMQRHATTPTNTTTATPTPTPTPTP